jgi:hypothetical protein
LHVLGRRKCVSFAILGDCDAYVVSKRYVRDGECCEGGGLNGFGFDRFANGTPRVVRVSVAQVPESFA